MKHNRRSLPLTALLLVLLMLVQSVTVFAAPGGKSSGSSVSYSGASTISSATTASGQNYASTTAEQNALLVSGGTSTLTNPTVTKTGSPSGSSDNYDFYGTNAAVLVYNGATLNITGGSITTDANYANAVFAYGTGVVNISDATIQTSARNSGGVMVTGGGTLTANNLTVTTSGNSAAAIRSDRGGGTLTVNGGSYTSSGTGSPAIYSTADITVNDATLVSTASEGVVVEGKNAVTLNNVTLTDTNTTHNGKSTTDKNIFLYQSMSGDASVGTSTFTASDSTITTNRGDTFYVTNTTAAIYLTDNTIINNDGDFLRAEAAAWGSSGSNGGLVTMTLNDQDVSGDIVLDSISTLDLRLTDDSDYVGTINGENTAQSVTLTLDADSTVTLTGDSYVTALSNADTANSNIYLNGYRLYVNGTAVSANTAAATIDDDADDTDTDDDADDDSATTFRDVASSAYYYDAVYWAAENGVTAGTSSTTFSPDAVCTRAQIVTFLWRAAGSPTVTGSNPFTDVASGSYYADAVLWAVRNGITAGTSATTFRPDAVCTRAQAMTFLYRAFGGTASGAANPFTDVASGSYYADAVLWAVNKGVTLGTGGTSFRPDAVCTRAQIVTFLWRCDELD
ncbi:MAG: S-layer homology domain-containing protein [Oscillospiraceae bacterium]|nr:S-layer homology domain-containing protein [Oscillospiraceae bacterium]